MAGPAKAPFTLGEEDKLSLRLPPNSLGGVVTWMSMIWNMPRDGYVRTLNDIKSQWDINEIPPELLNEIQWLVKYDVQSRNKEDQFDQKRMYIKLHESCLGYKEGTTHEI